MRFKSLFVDEIALNRKKKLKLSPLDTFDGTEDPRDHVGNYRTKIELHDVSEAQMCLAFPITLKFMTRV